LLAGTREYLWLPLHERADKAFTVADCANAEQPHRQSGERPDVALYELVDPWHPPLVEHRAAEHDRVVSAYVGDLVSRANVDVIPACSEPGRNPLGDPFGRAELARVGDENANLVADARRPHRFVRVVSCGHRLVQWSRASLRDP
jgi:hypothetical protein